MAALAALGAPWALAAPDAADPGAPVPRATYRSVFQDTPTGVEEAAQDWKKSNAEVGQFTRGHADIVKWEAQQAPAAAPRPAASQAPGRMGPGGGMHHHRHGQPAQQEAK